MSEPDIESLVAAGETARLEFKRSLADAKKIVETAAAMATIGGGTILVGVRDDGAVLGATEGKGELERLVQQILAGTDPKLYVDIDEPRIDGKRLLRLRIPAGDGPHLAFGRAFHRVGRATVAMSRDEYERRLLDRLRESSGFERRILTEASIDDIDPKQVRHFAGRARVRCADTADEISPRELVERLHLGKGDNITNAGVLLFGRNPQRFLPQAAVRAQASRGAQEDARAIEGSLFDQIEETVEFIARNLKVRALIGRVRREEQAELPIAAVREIVANAVAHRDYRSTAAIQVRVDDQGLEIWNPGHLPAPITLSLLRERHPSVPPNPFIARALFLAGYIEEWGTGTLRVIESMKANGNPEPLFEAPQEAGIRVSLYLAGAQPGQLSTRQASALAKLPVGKPFASSSYARIAKASLRTAGTDLLALERLGLVKRVGRGKATRWMRI